MGHRSHRSRRARIPVQSIFLNVPAVEFHEESVLLKRGRRREREGGEGLVPSERLANYLASGYRGAAPMRKERRIERNRRLLMLAFVTTMTVWFVFGVVL